MRPSRGFAFVVALGLFGCAASETPEPAHDRAASDDDETRIVSVPAPPEAAKPSRFDLVETAVLATGTDASREVTISLPIASTDLGLQTIESMFVRITPARAYDVIQDFDGNRSLQVKCAGPDSIQIEVEYRITRWPTSIDWKKEETRPLTANERVLLAPELGGHEPWNPTRDGGSFSERARASLASRPHAEVTAPAECVSDLRAAGIPARVVSGISGGMAGAGEAIDGWETYVPGVGWTPWWNMGPHGRGRGSSRQSIASGERGEVVVARNASGEPTATSAGKAVPLAVTYRWREAPER